jgi:hypothetical protein
LRSRREWGGCVRGSVHPRPLAPEENGSVRERQWASMFRACFGCFASIGVRERPWASLQCLLQSRSLASWLTLQIRRPAVADWGCAPTLRPHLGRYKFPVGGLPAAAAAVDAPQDARPTTRPLRLPRCRSTLDSGGAAMRHRPACAALTIPYALVIVGACGGGESTATARFKWCREQLSIQLFRCRARYAARPAQTNAR